MKHHFGLRCDDRRDSASCRHVRRQFSRLGWPSDDCLECNVLQFEEDMQLAREIESQSKVRLCPACDGLIWKGGQWITPDS